MNKTNFKLFTMFLAGIAFSAMTVLAATISISTNFEDGVTQYLKKLVILKNDNTTWMILDWDTLNGENIYGTNIYGTNITWTNIKGTNITWNKIYGQSGLFSKYCDENGSNCSSIEDLKLWKKSSDNNIYYMNENVWIGTNNPSEKLEVNGTGKFSGNISAKTGYFTDINVKKGYFSGIIIKGDANDTELKIGDNIHLSEAGIGGLIKFKEFLDFRSWMDEIMRINNQWNLVHKKNIIANGNISAKNGYFSGMEVKGGNVKSLSTVEHKLFTWVWIDDENGWHRKSRFFPKWVLTWEENEALETDSKRYIFCQDIFTWGFLLFGHKSVESQSGSLGYVVMPFTNNVQYDLKAWETFYLVHSCPSWNIKVNKQEYWWNTTSRE